MNAFSMKIGKAFFIHPHQSGALRWGMNEKCIMAERP
jgi:hypothetical protein